MLYSGLLDVSGWQKVIALLIMTHITIVAVTVYLHRHQAHRSLDLAPAISHFFRFWLWLTTGMVTREWAAIHRKHHAKCETPDDPHSPQVLGLNRVLWGGVFLYVKESRNQQTIQRYSHGTPDDWIENHLYIPHQRLGILLLLLLDLVAFGVLPGALMWLVQMAWIPFWAAGVINGIGHFWGYRHYECKDASTNIFHWGILIGGEELHNNHHAFATSAKLSNRWYEFDIGWMYIRLLALVGQARVKSLAPTVRFDPGKAACDQETLQSIIRNRYDVMARFAQALTQTCSLELQQLGHRLTPPLPSRRESLAMVVRWLRQEPATLPVRDQLVLDAACSASGCMQTVMTMREELTALWTRSHVTREQLVEQLADWCQRAEASGIHALQRFSRTLRAYA